MADDDLDAFLNEINAIEAEPEMAALPPPPPPEEVAPPVVIAKPQVIVKKPVHEVRKEVYMPPDETESMSVFEAHQAAPAMPMPTPTSTVSQPYFPVQQKQHVRAAGGTKWVDPTLSEWPENDFRIFVGDLGNEVTTDMLAREFQSYSSFAKAKVVRGGWNSKTKGYGFVSFLDAFEAARAIREKNGKYLGNRPMKITKSQWQERELNEVKKKEKKKRKLNESLGLA